MRSRLPSRMRCSELRKQRYSQLCSQLYSQLSNLLRSDLSRIRRMCNCTRAASAAIYSNLGRLYPLPAITIFAKIALLQRSMRLSPRVRFAGKSSLTRWSRR